MNTTLLNELRCRMSRDYFGQADPPRSRRSRKAWKAAHAKIMQDNEERDQLGLPHTESRFAGHIPGVSPDNTKSRSMSPVIWGNLAIGVLRSDRGMGAYMEDDFKSFGGTVTTKVGSYASESGSWKSYEETSGSIKQLLQLPVNTNRNTQAIGVVELATAASVSNTVAMEQGYGNAGSWGLTGNVAPRLAFECAVGINKTAVTGLDTFVGLCEKGGAANQFLISSADAMQQKSFIGFWSLTASPTVINAGYGKNGQAGTIPTVATAGAFAAPVSSVVQFTKLGFIYDPTQPIPILKWYQDGVLICSINDCTVSTFPNALTLTPLIYLQSDAALAAVTKLDADWIATGMSFE